MKYCRVYTFSGKSVIEYRKCFDELLGEQNFYCTLRDTVW